MAGGTDVLSYNNGITYKATSQLITSMELAMVSHLQTPRFLHSTEQQCKQGEQTKTNHYTKYMYNNSCTVLYMNMCHCSQIPM
jgi:hypothetical protein